MTEHERLKTDTVFVDTVIRECALMTIQKEADAQRIAELEERLEAASSPTLLPPDETRANALQQKLNEAIADLHFVMSGGDPARYALPSAILARNIVNLYGAERQVTVNDFERIITALLS